MSNDEFTKLFKYLEKRFAEVDQQFAYQDLKTDKVIAMIDSFSKRSEINDDERIVMAHQLTRLDDWVHQLADKMGVKLTV